MLITAAIILVIMICLTSPAMAWAYYSMDGVVLSTMDGTAVILTEDGNEWEIDKEDFDVNDRCFVVLDDMNTPEDQTDDVIRLCWYVC